MNDFAEKKEVVVIIDKKTGKLTTEVFGIKGVECSDVLNWVGKFGQGEKKNKPNYYQDNFQTTQILD